MQVAAVGTPYHTHPPMPYTQAAALSTLIAQSLLLVNSLSHLSPVPCLALTAGVFNSEGYGQLMHVVMEPEALARKVCVCVCVV